jgi:hypothetical protein
MSSCCLIPRSFSVPSFGKKNNHHLWFVFFFSFSFLSRCCLLSVVFLSNPVVFLLVKKLFFECYLKVQKEFTAEETFLDRVLLIKKQIQNKKRGKNATFFDAIDRAWRCGTR